MFYAYVFYLFILRSLYHHRPTHLKQLNEKGIHEESENISVVEFHPWKPEYKQIFTREKIKKSMTKDPYAQKKRRVAHANEKVVKKEECFLELIPTESVHIETPNIQQATSKVLCKLLFFRLVVDFNCDERFSA